MAVYFAVSDAVAELAKSPEKVPDRLAIWAFNLHAKHTFSVTNFISVPAGISQHISAQSGLFSVHQHSGNWGENINPEGLEGEEKSESSSENVSLKKLTLPTSEVVELYRLCVKASVGAANIFPSADGAGRAVKDAINATAVRLLLKHNGT